MADLKPILLVEDNPNDIELTLAALEKSQLANKIVICRDGAEALEYLRRQGPHADRPAQDPAVVLLDLKLPKVDGLEVLAAVKGDARMRAIPIVMLTSSREESDLVRSYQLGVNAFRGEAGRVQGILRGDPGSRRVLGRAQRAAAPPERLGLR